MKRIWKRFVLKTTREDGSEQRIPCDVDVSDVSDYWIEKADDKNWYIVIKLRKLTMCVAGPYLAKEEAEVEILDLKSRINEVNGLRAIDLPEVPEGV